MTSISIINQFVESDIIMLENSGQELHYVYCGIIFRVYDQGS